MPLTCAAAGCPNRYEIGGKILYHGFPLNNKELLTKWLINIKTPPDWVPTRYHHVCSQHFDDDCYWPNYVHRRQLKPDAVPTKFDMLVPQNGHQVGTPDKSPTKRKYTRRHKTNLLSGDKGEGQVIKTKRKYTRRSKPVDPGADMGEVGVLSASPKSRAKRKRKLIPSNGVEVQKNSKRRKYKRRAKPTLPGHNGNEVKVVELSAKPNSIRKRKVLRQDEDTNDVEVLKVVKSSQMANDEVIVISDDTSEPKEESTCLQNKDGDTVFRTKSGRAVKRRVPYFPLVTPQSLHQGQHTGSKTYSKKSSVGASTKNIPVNGVSTQSLSSSTVPVPSTRYPKIAPAPQILKVTPVSRTSLIPEKKQVPLVPKSPEILSSSKSGIKNFQNLMPPPPAPNSQKTVLQKTSSIASERKSSRLQTMLPTNRSWILELRGKIPCSLYCPGRYGELPALICENCLCLFHLECIGLLQHPETFQCPTCRVQLKNPGAVPASQQEMIIVGRDSDYELQEPASLPNLDKPSKTDGLSTGDENSSLTKGSVVKPGVMYIVETSDTEKGSKLFAPVSKTRVNSDSVVNKNSGRMSLAVLSKGSPINLREEGPSLSVEQSSVRPTYSLPPNAVLLHSRKVELNSATVTKNRVICPSSLSTAPTASTTVLTPAVVSQALPKQAMTVSTLIQPSATSVNLSQRSAFQSQFVVMDKNGQRSLCLLSSPPVTTTSASMFQVPGMQRIVSSMSTSKSIHSPVVTAASVLQTAAPSTSLVNILPCQVLPPLIPSSNSQITTQSSTAQVYLRTGSALPVAVKSKVTSTISVLLEKLSSPTTPLQSILISPTKVVSPPLSQTSVPVQETKSGMQLPVSAPESGPHLPVSAPETVPVTPLLLSTESEKRTGQLLSESQSVSQPTATS